MEGSHIATRGVGQYLVAEEHAATSAVVQSAKREGGACVRGVTFALAERRSGRFGYPAPERALRTLRQGDSGMHNFRAREAILQIAVRGMGGDARHHVNRDDQHVPGRDSGRGRRARRAA